MKIFTAIIKGSHTLNDITENSKIGRLSVWKILDEYAKKGILDIEKPARKSVGRREFHYYLSKKLHCMYFEECPRSYSCISINIEGNVVDRFDHAKRRDLTVEEDLRILYKKLRANKLFKKFCVDIIGVCTDEIQKKLPNSIIKTTRPELIFNILSEKDKIILFEIDGKLTTSAFGNTIYHNDDVTEDKIREILPIDKKYVFKDELDGVFEALQRHSIEKLAKL